VCTGVVYPVRVAKRIVNGKKVKEKFFVIYVFVDM
jgi:hypothetical protein